MKSGEIIENAHIYGLLHPVLVVRIIGDVLKYKVIIKEGKKEINYKTERIKGTTYLRAPLSRKGKRVQISILKGDKEIESVELKNTFMFRLLNRKNKQLIETQYQKISDNVPEMQIVECRIVEKKNEKKVKMIFETEEKSFEMLYENNNQYTKCKTKELGYNLYICSFVTKEDIRNISICIQKEDQMYYLIDLEEQMKKEKVNHEYHTTSIVGIQFCNLTGILNPALQIRGTAKLENPDIKVLADEQEVEITSTPLNDLKSFDIFAPLPKSSKDVKVLITVGGQDILIIRMRNTVARRVIQKIKSILKKIAKKIIVFFQVMYKGIRFLWREHHFLVPPVLWKKYFKLFIERMKHASPMFYNPFDKMEYNKWLKTHEEFEEAQTLKYNPLISIVVPVYNADGNYLKECIESVLNQTYKNFELCLVDDCSTKKETLDTLKEYEKKDPRIKIKYRKKNGHISNTTNDAIELSTGEFIALLDNDDLLSEHALYENVKVLNENKKIDMIYSDEDKLDLNGKRCDPNFKPDFSPDTLLSMNYICHFTIIRKKLIQEVGGFEVGLEGAQDHDLFLKISEKTNRIYHIPKILYHWRMSPTSTAMNLGNKDYASDKGRIAIEHALKRRKLKGRVERDPISTYYIVHYEQVKEPKISIIIPTKDYAETLDECLVSLYEKTTYKNYEVLVVNNNSVEQKTFDLFEKYKKEHKNFYVIDANFEFNYSKINNLAAKKAKGEYLVLLNNDTKIITPEWLEEMVGYASLPHVGAVGPKLLYPDNTVQHAGVILGLGGVASHAYIGADRNDTGIYGRLRVPYNYGAVTAACLMVSKRKFEEVKGLEEDLKVAYNDMDFNIKLLQKGYYNMFVPQIEIYHYESKSRGLDTTSEKYKRFIKESKYMWDKWGDILENDPFYNMNYSNKGWFVLDKNERESLSNKQS